jgi:HD-GYP domain-containing protein (c-di-GMP phosphodiesterase class II)
VRGTFRRRQAETDYADNSCVAVDGAGIQGDSFAFTLDPAVQESLEATRSSRADRLSNRDRLAVLVIGGAFVPAALALAMFGPAGSTPAPLEIVAVVLAYAYVSRLTFEVSTGSFVPTQLLLVPMLFAFPTGWVPLLVAAGYIVGSSYDVLRGRMNLERVGHRLVDSWHAVGPTTVLVLAGASEPALADWPIYAAALAAQFFAEAVSCGGQERLVNGTPFRSVLPYMARSQVIDAMLAPAGLAIAFAAAVSPVAILLVLPLCALLDVFSRERRARVDHALELSHAYRGTAFLLGDVVEADDAYTGLHSRDVVSLSVAVAAELRLDAGGRRDTELTALLHDVGKIRISPEILNKPGPLTDDERSVMETHTVEGESMLDQVGGLLGQVGKLVRSCHERWDGRGYPDGLVAGEIPVVARIVACCDAFSAMTTTRPYRAALPLDTAIRELHENAGSQFDPRVVAALEAVLGRGDASRPVD